MNFSKDEYEKLITKNMKEFFKHQENAAMLAAQITSIIGPLSQIIMDIKDCINNKEFINNISKLFSAIHRIENLDPKTKSLFWANYIDYNLKEFLSLTKDLDSLSDDEIKQKIKETAVSPERLVPYLPQSNIDENDFYLGYNILNSRPQQERINFFKYFKDDLSFNKNVVPSYINSLYIPPHTIFGLETKNLINNALFFVLAPAAVTIFTNLLIPEQKEDILRMRQQIIQIQQELQSQKSQSNPKSKEKEHKNEQTSQDD